MTRLATALALSLALTSTAAADTHYRHGSTCIARHASRDLVGGDERGIYNASSSTTATVTCATHDRVGHEKAFDHGEYTMADNAPVSVTSVMVYGRDLSSTQPFSCYLFSTADAGFSSWGPTKYMCSQSGGCPDATTEFVGNAAISWSTAGLAAAEHYGVVCNLPPASSSGSSYIKSTRTSDLARATYVGSPGAWMIDELTW